MPASSHISTARAGGVGNQGSGNRASGQGSQVPKKVFALGVQGHHGRALDFQGQYEEELGFQGNPEEENLVDTGIFLIC